LPLADRLTWNGLHALLMHEDDQSNYFFAHQMLNDAALQHNYPRAALLLATLQLEQGALDNIEQLLTIAAAGRNNHPKIELLRNYLATMRMINNESADNQPLPDDPYTQYQSGKFYLYYAQEATRQGEQDKAQRYRQQAARYLNAAAMNASSLPDDD